MFKLKIQIILNYQEKKLHPHYIIGEEGNYYLSVGITHDKKKGKGHNNHKLSKNPQKGFNEISYIRKQISRGNKKAYSKNKLTNYSMSKVDDEYIDNLISKNKRYK